MSAAATIWQTSFDRLKAEEPGLFKGFDHLGENGFGSLDELKRSVQQRQQALENKRWAIKLKNKKILIRDCLYNLLKAVQVVQEVGTALASLEPVYAGIPWACVNVVLNVRSHFSH
jgi:hypothetical protein